MTGFEILKNGEHHCSAISLYDSEELEGLYGEGQTEYTCQAINYPDPPTRDLAGAKTDKKNQVKSECRANIEATYPLWKQSNIQRDGGTPLTDMGTFIDDYRDQSDVMETAIDTKSTISDADAYDISWTTPS